MSETVPNTEKLTTAEQYEELKGIRDNVVGILAMLDEMLGVLGVEGGNLRMVRPGQNFPPAGSFNAAARAARPAAGVMSAVKVGQKADGARLDGMLMVAQVIVGEFEAGTDPAAIRRVAVATRDRARELLGEHLLKVMDELGSERAER